MAVFVPGWRIVFTLFIAALATTPPTSAAPTITQPPPSLKAALAFEDTFDRPNSADVGNGWLTIAQPGSAKPWGIYSNALDGGFQFQQSDTLYRANLSRDIEVRWVLSGGGVSGPHRVHFLNRLVPATGEAYRVLCLSWSPPLWECSMSRDFGGVARLLATQTFTAVTGDLYEMSFASYSLGSVGTLLLFRVANLRTKEVTTLLSSSDFEPPLQTATAAGLYREGALSLSSVSFHSLSSSATGLRRTTLFVHPTLGNDTSPGTSVAAPLRTLPAAIARVVPDRGDLVVLCPGVHVLALPAGTRLAVPSGTTVQAITGTPPPASPSKCSVVVVGQLSVSRAFRVSLSNFCLWGADYSLAQALWVRDAPQITLTRLAFYRFKEEALNLQRIGGGKFSYLDISDCSFNENKNGVGGLNQTRAIQHGLLRDCSFLNVRVNTRTRGGQAFGTENDLWEGVNSGVASNRPGHFYNVKYSGIDCIVDKWNAWASGSTPQMCLELFHAQLNVEISYSRFSGVVSIAGGDWEDLQRPRPWVQRTRVHHNLWARWLPSLSDQVNYAIEAAANGIEITYNFFSDTFYPVANFGADLTSLMVVNNIFVDGNQRYTTSVFQTSKKYFLKWSYNTIYQVPLLNNNARWFNFDLGENVSNAVTNNIFCASGAVGNVTGLTVAQNNLFWNVSRAGIRAVARDPGFKNASLTSLNPMDFWVNSTTYGAFARGSVWLPLGIKEVW